MQATMTRLGSKMPFAEAVEEVWLNHWVAVKEGTLRAMTYRHGVIAEALEQAEVQQLLVAGPPSEGPAKKLTISADGAMIALTTGEWREVKSMTIGEIEQVWNARKGQAEVKTRDISYFSRSYRIRQFEEQALAELHRRGLAQAQQIVTVNDGADWIQSFADYHFPQAVRVLDFSHAVSYLANVGQALFGEGTPAFQQWFQVIRHQFKHQPPARTLADLGLLRQRQLSDEQVAVLDQALFYLQKRLLLIDYPHFQNRGVPIGSGSVESGHKVVVHRRLKQAGMRWAPKHIDPLLALRNLICNGRWVSGWDQIVGFHWQQQHLKHRQQARRQRPSPPPITLDAVSVAPYSETADQAASKPAPSKGPYRPAPDHPWRNDKWPTKEAWRWRH